MTKSKSTSVRRAEKLDTASVADALTSGDASSTPDSVPSEAAVLNEVEFPNEAGLPNEAVFPNGTANPNEAPGMRIIDCTLGLPGTGQVLSALNLELRTGGVTWLVGESGAGKSTLCNLLAGLIPAGAKSTGTLEFGPDGSADETADGGGTDFHVPPRIEFGTGRGRRALAKLRRNGVIAWAPQNAMDTFPPRMRLREWFARAGIEAPELEPFGLEAAMLQKLPHQFSGGQISRISLAAAMARRPRLLVCDEPTAGLDPDQADAVVSILNDHARGRTDPAQRGTEPARRGADHEKHEAAHVQRRAILAVTHDLSAVQRNAHADDRVAVIFAGHIVENCSVSDFLSGRASNPYARALAAAAPAAGAHPLPVVGKPRPRPWTYSAGDEIVRLNAGSPAPGQRQGGDDHGVA